LTGSDSKNPSAFFGVAHHPQGLPDLTLIVRKFWTARMIRRTPYARITELTGPELYSASFVVAGRKENCI